MEEPPESIEGILLRTKLYRPKETNNSIDRPRLRAKIRAAADKPLTLVTAPSGYGKTTLVGSWLANEDRTAAWLSLDEYDNELVTFLSYMVAALRTVSPTAGQATTALLGSPQRVPVHVLADALIHDLGEVHERYWLVLDDYHVIEDEAIHEVLRRLIKYAPEEVRLLIISRSAPPFPLGSLRAAQRVCEVTASDLAFTYAEASELLTRVAGRQLDKRMTDLIVARTEGWAAALQLAGLHVRASVSESLVEQIETLGSDSFTDYLVDEVTDLIPSSLRDFLLRTAIVERFNVELCATLLHGAESDQREPAQQLLDQVRKANLFIVPLDDRRDWYRYHQLFREVLQRHLNRSFSRAEIEALHRQASSWFARNGYVSDAIRHAVAGGDPVEAARIVEARYHEPLVREDWRRLARWLDLLPDSVRDRPALLVAQGSIERVRVRLAAIADRAARAEQALRHTADADLVVDRETLQGEIHTLWATVYFWHGDRRAHSFHVYEAMSRVPPSRTYAASVVDLQHAYGLVAAGQTKQALTNLQSRLEELAPEETRMAPRLLQAMCYIYLSSKCDMPALKRTARTFLQLAEESKQTVSIGWATYSLAYVAYEWGDLPTAETCFRRITANPFALNVKCAADGFVGLCLTQADSGQYDAATKTLERFRQFLIDGDHVSFLPIADSLERRIALIAGVQWPGSSEASTIPFSGSLILAFQEYPPLTDARVRIAEGSETALGEATGILREVYTQAQASHNVRAMIETGALLALAHAGLGAHARALDDLEEALRRARPGRMLRVFLDCGAGLVPLLRQLIDQGREAQYARQILDAFDHTPGVSALGTSPLATQLTNREMDVLEGLAKRLSNKEIAAQLHLSPHTVRTHAQNLYSKLGVSNRREAVLLARQLRLVE